MHSVYVRDTGLLPALRINTSSLHQPSEYQRLRSSTVPADTVSAVKTSHFGASTAVREADVCLPGTAQAFPVMYPEKLTSCHMIKPLKTENDRSGLERLLLALLRDGKTRSQPQVPREFWHGSVRTAPLLGVNNQCGSTCKASTSPATSRDSAQ